MSTEQPKKDVYQIITDRIIEQLQKGVVPWQQPWTEAGPPQNLLSHRHYRGINTWNLASYGFEKNLFLTWKQIKELGASVKKDERSQMVVFWTTLQKEQQDSEDTAPKRKPYLRYYLVFNVSQCNDIPAHLIPNSIEKPNAPIKRCEDIVAQMQNPPRIQHRMQEAWYQVGNDVLNMPKRKSFISSEAYYGVLFHELIHSTGHPARLNRKELVGSTGFGSEPYSREELTAEIGACYLRSFAGIANADFENSVAYIDNWLGRLKSDNRFIVFASSYAQKAVDFILNNKGVGHDEVEEKEIATVQVADIIEEHQHWSVTAGNPQEGMW